MAKFKCKTCGTKYKVKDKADISCKRSDCPILSKIQETPQNQNEIILDFEEYQMKEFSTVSKFNAEDFGGMG